MSSESLKRAAGKLGRAQRKPFIAHKDKAGVVHLIYAGTGWGFARIAGMRIIW